jgi:hypothetical protein
MSHWDKVMAMLRPGGFVLMQFGPNDGGRLDDASRGPGGCGSEFRCSACIKGAANVEFVMKNAGYIRCRSEWRPSRASDDAPEPAIHGPSHGDKFCRQIPDE